ncbi:MAG: LysM peptidoglycan-binding domain-containing protein, partial [Sphingobacteriales bacterium]
MKNLLLLLFLCPLFIFAQDNKIMVEGNSSGYYLTHTTAPKENFYSIGRIYNISPRVYAPYNGLSVDAPGGLSIGQVLRIPLNEVNFSQDGIGEPGEVFVPLYFRAPSRVSLSSVSERFQNVPVERLQAWNRISGENVFAGSSIIIGFLKVKSDLSPLAKFAIAVPSSDVAVVKPKEQPAELPKSVIKEEPKKEVIKAEE